MKIDLKESWKAALKIIDKNKKTALLLLVGVVLILLPEITKERKNEMVDKNENESSFMMYSLEETEQKLEKILSGISGVGEVRVMLTLKTGIEKILAQDETVSKYESGTGETVEKREEKETSVVVIEGNEGDEAITVKYIYPEYLGALIVAEGAASASVKLAIVQAVTSVTGLPVGNVTVLSM